MSKFHIEPKKDLDYGRIAVALLLTTLISSLYAFSWVMDNTRMEFKVVELSPSTKITGSLAMPIINEGDVAVFYNYSSGYMYRMRVIEGRWSMEP